MNLVTSVLSDIADELDQATRLGESEFETYIRLNDRDAREISAKLREQHEALSKLDSRKPIVRACRNCTHYESRTMTCRRRSPETSERRWPKVHECDWCSEFAPKLEIVPLCPQG